MRQAALGILVMFILAGCGGGGGSSSSRLSKSEFDSKANAICDKYQKKIDSVPAPKNLKGIPDYIDKVLPIVEEGTSKLDDLNPPQDIEAKVDEWRRIQHEQVDQGKELKAAAEKGDFAKVTKIANEGNASNKRGNDLAREIGATTCAQD
jgi:hypothetical protein